MDCGELGVWYGLEGRDPNLKFYLRAVIKQTVEKGEKGETGLPNPTASSAMDEYALGITEPMSVGKESASASRYAAPTATGTVRNKQEGAWRCHERSRCPRHCFSISRLYGTRHYQ